MVLSRNSNDVQLPWCFLLQVSIFVAIRNVSFAVALENINYDMPIMMNCEIALVSDDQFRVWRDQVQLLVLKDS